MHRHTPAPLAALVALAAGTALLLTACAPSAEAGGDTDTLTIVASTNVYADIARTVAGDGVEVSAIIDDPGADPHSFEADARVQLALSKADIVIVNGGGYDDWATTLVEGSGNEEVTVLDAVELSGLDTEPAEGEFNEHVWYDLGSIVAVADAVADELAKLDAGGAETYRANAEEFANGVAALQERAQQLAEQTHGTGVAITEPVPLYLLEAAGLTNVTPEEFSEAIEEGTDVAPAVLLETRHLFAEHTAALLVYNEQTTGPETEQVLAAAQEAGTPVVAVTETLPEGMDYLGWMSANLDALEAALA